MAPRGKFGLPPGFPCGPGRDLRHPRGDGAEASPEPSGHSRRSFPRARGLFCGLLWSCWGRCGLPSLRQGGMFPLPGTGQGPLGAAPPGGTGFPPGFPHPGAGEGLCPPPPCSVCPNSCSALSPSPPLASPAPLSSHNPIFSPKSPPGAAGTFQFPSEFPGEHPELGLGVSGSCSPISPGEGLCQHRALSQQLGGTHLHSRGVPPALGRAPGSLWGAGLFSGQAAPSPGGFGALGADLCSRVL